MPWDIDPTNRGTGLPLEGVRVLDFSRVLAGPLCAMIAGDLGADVVKVEGPQGDPVRALAPPRFGSDSTYYLAVNRHRRNVVADLRDSRDFARVSELVLLADAVVENFLPSQVRDLGVDRLRALNPDCVWVSVTPATSGGPLAENPSFDLLAQARSGLMGVTGEPGGTPSKVGAPVADVTTGLYAALALVSGLYGVLRGRPGRRYEAPMLEATMSTLVNQAQGYLSTGLNPPRLGNDHPSIVPYGPVRTADGFLLLAVGTDQQWVALVRALDVGALTARVEWAGNDERVRERDHVRAALDEIFSTQTTNYWLTRLAHTKVPHAPIFDVAEAFGQPQIAGGDFVTEVTVPAGVTRTMGSPLLIDGRRPVVRRGPRTLGQDTAEIFGDGP